MKEIFDIQSVFSCTYGDKTEQDIFNGVSWLNLAAVLHIYSFLTDHKIVRESEK